MSRVSGVTLIINYEVDSCNKNNCYTNQQKFKKKNKEVEYLYLAWQDYLPGFFYQYKFFFLL